MACLRTIPRDESQTVGNSLLSSSGPTLNALLTFMPKQLAVYASAVFFIFYRQYKLDFGRLYSKSKKKRNTPIYFNTNYRREMKLVPIIMDYCLL